MTLSERIGQLVEQHGSLRAAARDVGLDWAYLHRLRSGEKTNPSPETLRKLGLRRVISYVPY